MSQRNIQAVIFDNKKWNTIQARIWLKKHKLKRIKHVDKTPNYLRYRLQSPKRFKSFATKKIKGNIMFILGFK